METTSYTENYLRLKLLEVKAGTLVLRELLLRIIHSLSVKDIDEFLSNFKNEIVKHSISSKYIKILFKTGGTEIKTWDISLLAYVLKHCCTLEGQLTLELESNPKNILNKEVKHVNGGNIDQFLNLNKGSIDQLIEDNEITEEQHQLLFPSRSGKTDINTWDIELLLLVLFKLCSSDTVKTIRNACKTVLTREVRLCSKIVDLRVFFAKHQSKFDKLKQEEKLTHPQSEQLYPPIHGVPPDINNFDDDVLISVVLNACQPFSQKIRESIKSIRQIRNNQAHPGDSEINHDDFKAEWEILYDSIFNIVDNELPQMKETVTDAVHDFAIGSLDIRSSLVVLKDFYTIERDKHMSEQLCEIESKLARRLESGFLSMEMGISENTRTLNERLDHQDALLIDLTKAVTDLQRKCTEPIFSSHRDIACFSVVLKVKGTSEKIVVAVEEFVINAMEGNVVDKNERIVKIIAQIMENFSKYEIRIVNIRQGCILLELQCVSIKGLLFTINTVNSIWLKQELNELAALFSKQHKSHIQISAFIPNSSLETIVDDIKRIDLECSPKKHQRFVEMELKASSVKGLVHVWQTLQGTELSSKLQAVSNILSSQHGEQVDIKVQLQPDTFQAALTSAEESISRNDQTEENPVCADGEKITPEISLQETSKRADEGPEISNPLHNIESRETDERLKQVSDKNMVKPTRKRKLPARFDEDRPESEMVHSPAIQTTRDTPSTETTGTSEAVAEPVACGSRQQTVTDLQRRYPETKFSEHRYIACFSVVFEVEGTSKETVDAVEDFVQKAMEVNVVDENEKIVDIINQISNIFSKYEIRIVTIRQGPILKSQCLSTKGLRYTINTVNEESTPGYDPTEDTPVSADESRENITPELSLQKTSIRTDKDPGRPIHQENVDQSETDETIKKMQEESSSRYDPTEDTPVSADENRGDAKEKPVDLESNASEGVVLDVGAVVKVDSVKPEAIESNIMAYSNIKALKHKLKKEKYVKEIENICVQTKGLNSDIINVAASPNSSGDPEFVVIAGNPETTEDKVKQSCPNINDYLITFRSISNEGRDVMYSDKCYNKHFTDLENTSIDKAISSHTENIMGKFKNVCAISACPVRSVGYGTCDAKIIEEVCIVILVDVKFPNQRLPLGQEPLPKKLDGLPVDIREGYVMTFVRKMANEFHENVRMGCEIGSETLSGTLGAFIELPNNKVGCLTSLHTIFLESEMLELLSGSSISQQRKIMQPSKDVNLLGHVIDAHFFEGRPGSQPGMEVAVIEIDSNRCPVDGEFPYCKMESYGYDEANPISYKSGRVYSASHLSNRKFLINKYGAATLLTEGKFFRKGSAIRVFGSSLYDQIEIQDCHITTRKDEKTNELKKEIVPFAQPGDSGALVLAPFEGNKDDLLAVGLLGGGTSNGTYYVTPIAAILEKCKLQCLKAFQQKQVYNFEYQAMDVDS